MEVTLKNGADVLDSLVDAPVARRKLADEVFDRLLHLIESGAVKTGEQMPSERELTVALQVGRPAVREALQRLERMGVISISHGERARVATLTPDALLEQIGNSVRHLLGTSPQSAAHLKEARLMFESAMVRLAVAKASDHDIETLRDAFNSMRNARRNDPEFVSADLVFHETIASISGNPLFGAISKALLTWLSSVSFTDVSVSGGEDLAVAEHEQILRCIESRDVDGAVRAMVDHLTRSNQLYSALAHEKK